jgi:hypothetical protein
MRKIVVLSGFLAAACCTQAVWAQHSDVEFGYDDLANPMAIIFENDDESVDGIQYWEGEFEDLDPTVAGDDWGSDEPGFTTEASEGLLFNSGDNIWISALDASSHSSFGSGFVNYFNPNTGMLEANHRVSLLDDAGSTSDMVLDGGAFAGDPLQFLGSVDADGDLHDHITLDLLDDATAPAGAYGVLLQVHADFGGDGTVDLESDPFWFIYNHQMDEGDFDSVALRGFGVVPEPSSLALLFAGSTCLLVRRRK